MGYFGGSISPGLICQFWDGSCGNFTAVWPKDVSLDPWKWQEHLFWRESSNKALNTSLAAYTLAGVCQSKPMVYCEFLYPTITTGLACLCVYLFFTWCLNDSQSNKHIHTYKPCCDCWIKRIIIQVAVLPLVWIARPHPMFMLQVNYLWPCLRTPSKTNKTTCRPQ